MNSTGRVCILLGAALLLAGGTVAALIGLLHVPFLASLERIPLSHAAAEWPAARAYNEDQISILVRTFSITASVNSVVPAWPPRSTVRVPAAVVSRVPS